MVGTPRRQHLGGGPDGAAVDVGGVGPRPARPNDSTTLGRGRSSAEPTARRSGMAATSPPMGKAGKRVAHGHRSTEARGMPSGEARAARGGELAGLRPQEAGAPQWRYRRSRRADESADCGMASPRAPAPAGAPAVAGLRPLPRVEGQPCPVVCLPPHGRERPSETVWRPWRMTRLVWDCPSRPLRGRIATTRLEGKETS